MRPVTLSSAANTAIGFLMMSADAEAGMTRRAQARQSNVGRMPDIAPGRFLKRSLIRYTV
jgi:hypothetical protein